MQSRLRAQNYSLGSKLPPHQLSTESVQPCRVINSVSDLARGASKYAWAKCVQRGLLDEQHEGDPADPLVVQVVAVQAAEVAEAA